MQEITKNKKIKIGQLPISKIPPWLTHSPEPLQDSTLIEGTVIIVEKTSVFIDLPPYGTGIIYGREFINAKDLIKNLSPGSSIKVKVLTTNDESGYIELSLKEARAARILDEAKKAIEAKTLFTLPVKEATKGGLLLEWQGIQGFLPASQLKSEHYPRVEGGDKSKIFKELKKLVGEELNVFIISATSEEDKLVFSEKQEDLKERKETIAKYSVGDEVECEVTGIVNFGVFLKIEEGIEGLVHISEMDWGLVENPGEMFKVGDLVKAKIIEIKDEQISLSTKALKENPWEEFEKTLKKGDFVKGVVIKYNKHGALVSIKEGVAGLVHKSNFSSEKNLLEKLELGKTYDLQISTFDPKNQRLTLTYLEKESPQ